MPGSGGSRRRFGALPQRHDRSRSPRQSPIIQGDAHEDITKVVGGLFLDTTLSALQPHRIFYAAHDGGERGLVELENVDS